MTQSVMIRGRYVPTNRPLGLVAAAVVMGIVSGINLGIGVNTYCFSYDSYCDYRKKAYIISGSCFAASSYKNKCQPAAFNAHFPPMHIQHATPPLPAL
ncbi:uncharacterized protein LOC123519412 isoform X2 [Portunus trituberculatus]|uniref:uncharacterized protein LOC123519412 isoform X2 n=1 Tax=Portunus trituberculatus TaxID=210409 RepID=UPI001E1CBD72|nr:uncharacterized protein LOC123519412 isoform X2 [Portunus trituberculatus]